MKPGILWKKVVTTFYRRMVVVTKDVDSSLPLQAPLIDASIFPLSAAQFDDYFVFRPGERRDEIGKRIAAGHICFAAWHHGRIVHAGWSARGRAHIPYIHRDVLLGPEDFYIYDSFTLPDFRRSNLVVARSAAMHSYYGELGFKRSYGVVAFMNRGGMAVLDPSGYRQIGMYGCIRIGPVHHTWEYPGAVERLPTLVPHEA